MKPLVLLMIAPLSMLAAACSPATEEQPAPVRPVLTQLVQSQASTAPEFVGVVAARTSVAQAFRIGGTLVTRQVETGDTVREGQVFATLDATTSELAVQTARANLASAEAQYANAAAAESRLRTLNQSDVVSLANLEQAEQQTSAANAARVQAQSRLSQAEEQLSYATLIAPMDGVVMSVGAEPGSVVAAGQAIVTIADPTTRDVVIDLPETIISDVTLGTSFEIAPQLAPSSAVEGKVREIAPQANPLTRTWRVKIGIDGNAEQFWLGTTATARLLGDTGDRLTIPASALRTEGDITSVFVVDASAAVVRQRAVTVESSGEAYLVSEGLDEGERIVIAGVNSLSDGQQVKLDQESAK